MKKGLFIVLEGGEGVGKSTQIARLKDYLPAEFPDREFIFTREPGGSPFAEKIRELIVGDGAKHANGRTMIGLFMASRADHIEHTVGPALEEGKVVICDRYLASSYAYQVVAQESPELSDIFWAYAKLMPQPDLTLFLDMDPDASIARLKGRDDTKSHFDERAKDFHARVREGFKRYLEESQTPARTINTDVPIEDVQTAVREAIVSVL